MQGLLRSFGAALTFEIRYGWRHSAAMPQPPRSDQIRFPVDPRDVPPEKAARRLHLTLSQFEKVLPQLLKRGFPPPDPDTGNFDLKIIDLWMDGRTTVVATASPRGTRELTSYRRSLLAESGSQPLDARVVIEERLKLLGEGKIGPRTRKRMQAEKAAKAAQKALLAKPEE